MSRFKDFCRAAADKVVALYAWFVRATRFDGLLHIIVSAVLASVLLGFCPVWLTIIIVGLVGVGKELYDLLSGRGSAELHDLLCDMVGLVGAISVYYYYFCVLTL